MKLYSIHWTDFSVQALHQIQDYLETESGSSLIAERYILKLISRVDQLSRFPESGEREPLLQVIGQNSRYLIEGNYKIIYQLDEKRIIITDVFHTKQNPKKIVSRKKK